MRNSTVCLFVLCLCLCGFAAGCGGDSGAAIGKDAQKLTADMLKDVMEAGKDEQKRKDVKTKWQPKAEAIKARYDNLPADEKKKAKEVYGDIEEIAK